MKRAILASSSINVFSIKVEALYLSWLMTHSFLPFLIERRTPQRHLHPLLKFSSFVCFVWAVNVDVCTSQTVVTLAIIITILHSRHCDVSRLVNLNLSPAPNTFFPRDSIIKTLNRGSLATFARIYASVAQNWLSLVFHGIISPLACEVIYLKLSLLAVYFLRQCICLLFAVECGKASIGGSAFPCFFSARQIQ